MCFEGHRGSPRAGQRAEGHHTSLVVICATGRGFVPGGDPNGQGSRQMISQGGRGHVWRDLGSSCGVAPRPPAGQRGGRSPSAREQAEVLQEAFALLSEDFPCGLGFPAPLKGLMSFVKREKPRGGCFLARQTQ